MKNNPFIRYPAPMALHLDSNTNFPSLATQANLRPLAGDFNGDGLSDIALVSYGLGWSTIPIAFSAGLDASQNMAFWSSNLSASFPTAVNAMAQAPKVVSGDFNGDGLTDLAALGIQLGSTLQTYIEVALSNGDGTFTEQQVTTSYSDGVPSTDVNFWGQNSNVQIVSDDFNGDGLADIALLQCGVSGWGSLPVVFANGGALGSGVTPGKLTSFTITNRGGGGNATFANTFANQANTQLVSGDFDGDGSVDLALTGGQGWLSVPIVYSSSTRTTSVANLGLFSTVNNNGGLSTFASAASGAGVVAFSASQGK